MDKSSYDSELLIALGRAVRHTRKAKKMTQEDLGGAAQLDGKYIGKIENGKRNITMINLEKICIGLNMEAHELFKIGYDLSKKR